MRLKQWILESSLVMLLGLVLGLLALPLLPGCAIDPETGERVASQAAPTPPEAKLIAHGVMRLAVSDAQKWDAERLAQVKTLMLDAESVLLAGLARDPEHLDAIRMNYLKDKNPEFGELANTVLQVLVIRLRPLIDQGRTGLAAEYVEAVIAGAVQALDGRTGAG